MKVGVLTWAFNTNYGGSLQGLALLRYLQDAGVDAEMVNYLPRQSDMRLWQDFDLTERGWLRNVLKVLFVPLFKGYNFYTVLRVVNTKRFWRKFLRPNAVFKNGDQFRSQERYEAVVVGSDQVWNPEWLDEVYLLADMAKKIRRIAFSSSVAAPTLKGHEAPYRKSLPCFDAIAVRECQTLSEISELSGKEVKWVVDPTLLHSGDEWRRILGIKDTFEGDYDVVYWLADVDAIVDELLRYVNRTNRKVYVFVDLKSFFLPGYRSKYVVRHFAHVIKLLAHPKIRFAKYASARTFVRIIGGARHVITNSFHGMMFSAIFKRNFLLVLDRGRKSMHSRMVDFMERTKIETPVCYDFGAIRDHVEFMTTYPQGSSDELDKWIAESKCWLDEIINAYLRA